MGAGYPSGRCVLLNLTRVSATTAVTQRLLDWLSVTTATHGHAKSMEWTTGELKVYTIMRLESVTLH